MGILGNSILGRKKDNLSKPTNYPEWSRLAIVALDKKTPEDA